jgi:hypothetical protein
MNQREEDDRQAGHFDVKERIENKWHYNKIMAKIKDSSKHIQFAQAAIGSRNRIWFSGEEEDLFRLLQLKTDKWSVKTPDWNIVSLTGKEKEDGDFEVIVLGSNGELLTGFPGGFAESHLDEKNKTPEKTGILRDIKIIGGVVVAVGMGPQVYLRKKGKWSNISPETKDVKKADRGFNAVDGLKENEVVAVGYQGAIWLYNGKVWKQIESKTTMALNAVLCLLSGDMYVCGASGTILKGNAKGFSPVENKVTTDNFYSLAYFQGKIYVSSLTSLYLIDNGKLELVKEVASYTTGHLYAHDDIMISTGARHILLTEDGVKWKQLFCTV